MQVKVAIVGFGEFERDALSFCIRNALTSDVDYSLCEGIAEADLIVADSDSPSVIDRIVHAARTPHVVFVGRNDVPGAVNRVPRPIDPARVLRSLDEMAADVLREHIVTWADTPLGPPVELPVEMPPRPEPAVPDPRISTKAQVRRAVRRAQGSGGGPPLVDALVLDPDDADRATLAELLKRFGFIVHEAASPGEAASLIGTRRYAAAFLDVAFDGSDRGEGIEVCRVIKEKEAALALIIVSGRLDPSDQVRARLVGADVHLTKPLTRGDVARSLEECGVSLPADARRA